MGENLKESEFNNSKYPMTYEEFEKRVMELFLRPYGEYLRKIILDRLDGLLSEDPNFFYGLYGDVCFSYDHPEIYGENSRKSFEDYHLRSVPVNALEMLLGESFNLENINDAVFVVEDEKMNLEGKLEDAEELYQDEDNEQLIEKCDEILEEFPKNQTAMGYKSFAYYALGDYDNAIKILEEGIELYPKNYYFKNNLAMVYYALGDYETSLTLCEEGLEITDFDWLCENKFKNLILLGRYDEACEFEKSVEPEFPWIFTLIEEGFTQHKLDYCHYLLKKNPDDVLAKNMIKIISSKTV